MSLKSFCDDFTKVAVEFGAGLKRFWADVHKDSLKSFWADLPNLPDKYQKAHNMSSAQMGCAVIGGILLAAPFFIAACPVLLGLTIGFALYGVIKLFFIWLRWYFNRD